MPHSFAFFAKGWGLFREVEGNLLSRVFPQPISAMPLKQILFTPRASASLARAGLTQPSGLCPTSRHFSSAGAEYSSPARERWVEISHDRVLQGRHNHVLCLRFRMFFAKAGRQSSPRPSLPTRRDLCPPARFALKGTGFSRAAKVLLVYSPSERRAREA